MVPLQVRGGAVSFVVPNLAAGTPYTVRVAAYNAQGYSPFATAAPALGTWGEVQAVLVTAERNGEMFPNPLPFSLRYQDQGGAYSGSQWVPVYGTAEQVQDALQRLPAPGVRAVLVSKEEQSDFNNYDMTGAPVQGVSGAAYVCAPLTPIPSPLHVQCTQALIRSTK